MRVRCDLATDQSNDWSVRINQTQAFVWNVAGRLRGVVAAADRVNYAAKLADPLDI